MNNVELSQISNSEESLSDKAENYMHNNVGIMIIDDDSISIDDITKTSGGHQSDEPMKLEDVPPLKNWQYGIIYCIVLILIGLTILYTILSHHDIYNLENDSASNDEEAEFYFLGILGLKLGMICFVYYLNGYFMVKKLGVRVNYTRKINHFASFMIPFITDEIVIVENSIINTVWNLLAGVIVHVVLTIPMRKYDFTGALNIMYSSSDRPEDRPHTLNWLTLQNALTGVALFPLILLWQYWNIEYFKYIPLIIATFGDGMAEVIGVRFGKHKYETRALFTKKKYTRSLEGSACVFISGILIIIILFFTHDFSKLELLLNLLFVPIAATLTEAYSPHTMDNPFIIGISGGLISLSHYISWYASI